ncbi:MAG: TIGR04211 family SH3 domain-containing protein [Syntrophobacteria bacterium]
MAAQRHRKISGRAVFSIGLILFAIAWLLCGTGRATTLYVSDTTLEANLRTGTTKENRIIALVRPGTQVTLLSEEEGWAEVALEDGRTGWILRRYLSDRPPWRVTATKLAAENEQLGTRLREIERLHGKLVEQNSTVEKKLKGQKQQLREARQKYEDLKKASSMYLNLKEAYENLQKEARQHRTRLDEVQKAYEQLKMSTNIRWFLSGGGVLVVGWLVGLSMGRMRRRRSTDYYRL